MKANEKYVIEVDHVANINGAEYAFIKGFDALVFTEYGLGKLTLYNNDCVKAFGAGEVAGMNKGKEIGYENGYADALEDALRAFATWRDFKIVSKIFPDAVLEDGMGWLTLESYVRDIKNPNEFERVVAKINEYYEEQTEAKQSEKLLESLKALKSECSSDQLRKALKEIGLDVIERQPCVAEGE